MPTSLNSGRDFLFVHPGEPSPCLMLVLLCPAPRCTPLLVYWPSALPRLTACPVTHSPSLPASYTQSLSVRLLSRAPPHPTQPHPFPSHPVTMISVPLHHLLRKNRKSGRKKQESRWNNKWTRRTSIFLSATLPNGKELWSQLLSNYLESLVCLLPGHSKPVTADIMTVSKPLKSKV